MSSKGSSGRHCCIFYLLCIATSISAVATLFLYIDPLTGVARCFGSDADAKAIKNVFTSRVRPGVEKINEALAQGGDPKEIEVSALWAAAIRGRNGDASKVPHFSAQHVSICL